MFGSLLDRGAGAFRLGPFGINVPSNRSYEPGTNTLITSWKTPTGWAIVRDALAIGPRRGKDVVTPHTRPPADDDAYHLLVRTVECTEGTVQVELVCEPGFDYGRVPGEWTLAEDGHRAEATGAGQTITLATDMLLGIEANHVRAQHGLQAGERVFCALSWGNGDPVPSTFEEADAQLAATKRFWRSWLARARIPDHQLGPLIQRSALAIKGLTYMPTGATVAALTTSLPETPGGERNWDYRYTWMRDSTFTLQALHYLGLDWEAREFMQFIADLERNDDGGLQIMYGIDGRRDLTEALRDDLTGYAGAHPVRTGNGAFDQRQNDVFGAALDSVLAAHPPQPAAATAPVAADPVAGRVRDGGVGQTRSGNLGGARQAAALRLVEADVLGSARPRRAARGASAAIATSRPAGRRRPMRSKPTSSSTASTAAAC